MDAATIVEWQVKPGDNVRKGQVVGVVETEKAAMDIEFFREGVVDEILVPIGEKVSVGTPLIRFHAPSAAAATPPGAAVAVAAATATLPASECVPAWWARR